MAGRLQRGDGVRAGGGDAAGRAPLLGGVAVGLAGLVYLNALHNPFVYDDLPLVLENPSIRDLTHWRWILAASLFRPLVNLSYALDHALWGGLPLGYHLTSVLLHMANVGLVFRLARVAGNDRAALAGAPAGPAGRSLGIGGAAALLFAVHPVMTESVAYVSGRAEVLCGTFFLLGILAFRRAIRDGGLGAHAGGLAALAAAVAAKEVGAMLPLVLLAYDRLLGGGSREARRRRLIMLHAPLLALVALAAVARLLVFQRLEGQPPPVAAWQYGLMQAGVVWRYVGLLLAPVSQSVVHSVRVVTSPLDGPALAAVAALALMVGLLVRGRRRAPLLVWGLAWFALLLLPSSSLIPLGQAMAEHRVYLASVGFFVAVGVALEAARAWLAARGLLPSPPVRRAALASGVLVLAFLTVARNAVWADPVRLWRDAARKAPDVWLPHYALGEALRLRDDCGSALPAYREAQRLRPEEPLVYPNWGACLLAVDRLAEARGVFERGLRVDPGSARLHNNLGVVAQRAGDPPAARRHFLEALARDAGQVPARLNLARLYEGALADPAEALRLCREVRELAPAVAGVEECVRRNEGRLAIHPAGS